MNSLVQKYSSTSFEGELRKAREELNDDEIDAAMWGSSAGFGLLNKGVPTFNLPSVPDVRIAE